MSNIVEFAKTRNSALLISAGKQVEDTYRATQQAYENLILNHMGGLLGINECEYTEAFQYVTGDLLRPNQSKAMQKLERLSEKGYSKATKDVASEYISSNPSLALKYYSQCLNDPSVDQGEINEQIGYLYFSSDVLDTREGYQYLKVAADQHNRGFAQFILASMYFNGEGVEKDIETSYSYCIKAANNNDEHAEYWLGKDFIFAEEYPLDQDVELGLKYLNKAAEKGHRMAQYILGFIYFDGDYVAKDNSKAEDLLIQAKYGEIPGAYAYLGQLNYERGDYDKAKEYLETSYNQFRSMLWAETLVKIYKNGLGCPADTQKAVVLIDDMISNDSSNVEDVEFAANCYFEGKAVVRDVNKAVRYYGIVENNNPAVKYKLGCIALDGSSSILSKNDCIRYFEYAGSNGYPNAFSKLAHYFLSVNNKDRALDYFKRSFNAGNVDDGVMVGRIYEAGTPSMYKNMSEAVNWYKAAAEKGSAKAKEELTHIKSGIFGYKRI